jgi:hypothetical protein
MTTINFDPCVVTDRVRTLHAVRVAGWLSCDRLAAWFPDANPELDVLSDTNLFKRVAMPGEEMFALTSEGEHAAQVALDSLLGKLDDDGRAPLRRRLLEFERFDGTMKDVVTAVQRDRSSARADAVGAFHRDVAGVVDAVASAFPLWRSYGDRLGEAVRQIERGDYTYVASPVIDSYHTTWHLLHRDMRLVVAAA